MKLVHFTNYDGNGTMSFVADKIISFVENATNHQKTSIFVLTASSDGGDEFVVGDNYRKVVSIMEKI